LGFEPHAAAVNRIPEATTGSQARVLIFGRSREDIRAECMNRSAGYPVEVAPQAGYVVVKLLRQAAWPAEAAVPRRQRGLPFSVNRSTVLLTVSLLVRKHRTI
jgi:hypothetical protein